MTVRVKKLYPALKHGGYAAVGLLPGESAAEFAKLHRGIVDEISPTGPLEDDIVSTLARLLWRKQNLATFRMAELARRRVAQIWSEMVPQDQTPDFPVLTGFETKRVDPAVREAAIRDVEMHSRKELGDDAYELTDIGSVATIDGLMKELEVQDRLDSMIERGYKRLLLLRGIKSLSAVSPSAPPKRLAKSSKVG